MLVNTLAASTHFECFITTPHSWVFLICFFIVFLGPLGGIWVTLMGQAQQLQEQHYPFLQVSVVFSCVHTRIWPPVFNVRSNIDACSCTWGLYWHHNRVCTGRWLWEKIPLLRWVREPALVSHLAFQSCALFTELLWPCKVNYQEWSHGGQFDTDSCCLLLLGSQKALRKSS